MKSSFFVLSRTVLLIAYFLAVTTLFALTQMGKWLPPLPVLTIPENLLYFLYYYFGGMILLLLVAPVGKREDKETWGSFIYYAGCLFALIIQGIRYNSEDPSSFYLAFAILIFHCVYSGYISNVFVHDFWSSTSHKTALIVDEDEIIEKGGYVIESQSVLDKQPVSMTLFYWVNWILSWANRLVAIAFVAYFFLPDGEYPVPDVYPEFIVSCLVLIELITKSALKTIRKSPCNPLDWVVCFYGLGLTMGWLLIKIVLSEDVPLYVVYIINFWVAYLALAFYVFML